MEENSTLKPFDKYAFYHESVQSPDSDVEFKTQQSNEEADTPTTGIYMGIYMLLSIDVGSLGISNWVHVRLNRK